MCHLLQNITVTANNSNILQQFNLHWGAKHWCSFSCNKFASVCDRSPFYFVVISVYIALLRPVFSRLSFCNGFALVSLYIWSISLSQSICMNQLYLFFGLLLFILTVVFIFLLYFSNANIFNYVSNLTITLITFAQFQHNISFIWYYSSNNILVLSKVILVDSQMKW